MAPRPRSAQTLDDRRSRGTRSYRCRVCRGIHPLRKCNRFLRLSTEKRLRAVIINKYCANCLAHQHSEEVCRSGDTCKKCGQDHHTLLHMRESSSSRRQSISPVRPSVTASRPSASGSRSRGPTPSSRNRSQHSDQAEAPTAAPSVASLLQHRSVQIIPTAIVVLDTGTNKYETGALIDPCSPVSTIDRSLAAAFRLPTTSVGDETVCSATIRSRTGTFKIDVVLKVSPNFSTRTPIRALADDVRARFNDIRLADEQFHRPATISLVLGSDVYRDVIQPGFLNLDEGLPVAQSTVFGWIVSGSCRQS
ncbi:uncharacterized protein LOC128263841 [Drosophila gunungcola]|uniref:uncharacterized protein LOC128263841 n=1 Tax=Drosophila gunungcola TaxID=103775 RepID=UPI0022E95645|nr:uncharacterized protein LOC128263841 [Drosophila gunungcola]